ncbi:aminoglycoside phosphotransferase family protein [Streptomyces sp. NPDC005349]|uniref:phosphotransferase enzyme family protein n=1 Tax=Streptomyces sp. NPDC005349 TaxID=3157037 RepID=UPI0033BD70B5
MDFYETRDGLNESNARRAMLAACDSAGLPLLPDAELLRLGENALFALPEIGVVARVARSTEMADKVAKELAVARWLAEYGFPSVQPTDTPQPIEANGRLVTFWEYVPESPPPASNTILAALLRGLHDLPDPDFQLPVLDPFPIMRSRLEAVSGIKREDVAFLAEACDNAEEDFRTLIASSPKHLVHGDAHRGNILWDGNRALLIDYEAVAIGPRAWDLVPTVIAVDRFGLPPKDYAEFVRTYGMDVTEWHGYPVLRTTRELGMTTWLMQNAQSGPEADEFALRMESLRKGDLERRWHAL